MNKIALIYGDLLVYWSSIILALAVATGLLFFLASWLRGQEGVAPAAAACPMMIVLSLLLGRLAHWYFLPDSYESLAAAMTDFSTTGYALIGAFAGCLLTAGILRLLKLVRDLPFLLDCMSIGGCAAIALGRLSCFFTSADRGEILEGFTGLPLVFPVLNETSGLMEYRFATFFFQALTAGLIFVLLLLMSRKKHRHGDIALVFLLLYCASQIVLDSTRYDALHLRSNGFVSAVQVLCALTLVLVISVLLVHLIKEQGWKRWYLAAGILAMLCLCGAGCMEYYVQRHGDQAALAYCAMGGCLGALVLLGLALLHLSNQKRCPNVRA